MVTLDTVLQEMRDRPMDFLRHYRLFIGGGGEGHIKSGIAVFRFNDRSDQTAPGFTTGFSGLIGLTKSRPKIEFVFRRMAKNNPKPGANEFLAHYIAMVSADRVKDAKWHMVSGGDSPDIMLTSQLSGCTVGVGMPGKDGGRVLCHIEPSEHVNGGDLDQTVRGVLNDDVDSLLSRRIGEGGSRNYGDNRNRANMIGIRRDNQWRFYRQSYRFNPAQIMDVREVVGGLG